MSAKALALLVSLVALAALGFAVVVAPGAAAPSATTRGPTSRWPRPRRTTRPSSGRRSPTAPR